MTQFNRDSTAEEVTAGLDLTGHVALVTGATAGVGLESMRVLAMRGAHVIGTGRTTEKAATACEGMSGQITPVEIELTDLESVNKCAATILETGLTPTIVILNAGIGVFGDLELVSGIEKSFFANYLGHFVLVNNLLPSMLEQRRGRIIHVSSDSAYKQDSGKIAPPEGIDFDNLRGEREFDAGLAYGRSKLANALFSYELAHRLDGTGLTSNAVHPGSVLTNITHSAPQEIRDLVAEYADRLKTPAQGAATQVYVATSPDLEGISGQFFADCAPVTVEGENFLEDKALAERLWAEGEAMAGSHLRITTS